MVHVGEKDMAAGFGGVRAPRPTHGFDVGCRAASPLAAVAVCAGGRMPGRDESLPYGLNRKRDMAVSCGPGMPLQDAQFSSGIFGWLHSIFYKYEQNMSLPS